MTPSVRRRVIAVSAVAAVAVVVAGIVVATSGGSGSGNGSPVAGAGGGPAGKAGSSSDKVFTKLGDECSLIKPSTLAAVAPGATCSQAPTDKYQLAGYIFVQPSWKSADDTANLDVKVDIGANAADSYRMAKSAFLKVWGGTNPFGKLTDSRALPGLGDEAFIAYSADLAGPGSASVEPGSGTAELVVRWGNASVEVQYTTRQDPSGAPKSQQQAEDAATSVARDVLASLS